MTSLATWRYIEMSKLIHRKSKNILEVGNVGMTLYDYVS